MKKFPGNTDQLKGKKDNLAEEVLRKLQEAIISGDLRPNERLIEKKFIPKIRSEQNSCARCYYTFTANGSGNHT
jgi:hypothetical protein